MENSAGDADAQARQQKVLRQPKAGQARYFAAARGLGQILRLVTSFYVGLVL
jgi:hypothetical protein